MESPRLLTALSKNVSESFLYTRLNDPCHENSRVFGSLFSTLKSVNLVFKFDEACF